MKIRKLNAATALGSLTASVALLAGMNGAHAQGAPGAGSFPGSFLVPGTQTSLKVGGYVKVDFTYDFGPLSTNETGTGTADNIGINPPTLDSHCGEPAVPHFQGGVNHSATCAAFSPRVHGGSQIVANESRFNIETRTPTGYGELKTFIEGDFANPNGLSQSGSLRVNTHSTGFRLRQAYGTLGPFLAGQTASLFRDPSSEGETLDFTGDYTTGRTRDPQFRYTFDFGNGLTWAAAAEAPATQIQDAEAGATATTFGKRQADKIPDFTTAVTWSAPWGHLRGSAVFRDIYWHTGLAGSSQSQSTFGWGASFTGSWNVPIGKDGLAWEVGYGRGAGAYLNSQGPPSADAVWKTATAGGGVRSLRAIPIFMATGNYTHFWTDQLRSNITGSYLWTDWKASDFACSQDNFATVFKSGYTGHVNLIWSPVPQVNLGVEFMYIEGKLKSGQAGNAERLQVSAQFKF